MEHILLLEDDIALGNGICLALQSPYLRISLYRTLAQAGEALEQGGFDLLILDVNLPDGSGLDLLRRVRRSSPVPIILLTANDMEMDIVTGLESGADDYITKPFSLAVLRARVNAQLRRGAGGKIARFEPEGFLFDFDRMVFRRKGQPVELMARRPAQLSGGQLQRFALVRALLPEPRLLIADEAVSALDVAVQEPVLRLFAKLRDRYGIAVLFISHDLAVVKSLCSRVLVMYQGEIVEEGDTAQVFAAPAHPYTRQLLAARPKIPGADPADRSEEQ